MYAPYSTDPEYGYAASSTTVYRCKQRITYLLKDSGLL